MIDVMIVNSGSEVFVGPHGSRQVTYTRTATSSKNLDHDDVDDSFCVLLYVFIMRKVKEIQKSNQCVRKIDM